MKQIYDFEKERPPVLNENMLKAELQKRKLQKQMAMVLLSSILSLLGLLTMALMMFDRYPLLLVSVLVYIVISVAGGGTVAAVFWVKRRSWMK